MRKALFILPWLLVIVLGLSLYISFTGRKTEVVEEVTQTTILQKVEAIGKMELVRYNFKEVTEVTELSKEYFRLFKIGPDSKIALVSAGNAVGCIDLTKVKTNDLALAGDTVYLRLPEPEICYYKLDMENTRIFHLQTNPLKDESKFIQKAYKTAEREIEKAALNSGILEQTKANAQLILRPMLEGISGKTVILTDDIPGVSIDLQR